VYGKAQKLGITETHNWCFRGGKENASKGSARVGSFRMAKGRCHLVSRLREDVFSLLSKFHKSLEFLFQAFFPLGFFQHQTNRPLILVVSTC